MRRLMAAACMAGGVALLFGGCGWSGDGTPRARGGVAVIDLDEIARKVGAGVEMSEAIKAHEVSLNAQLQNLKTSYVQQLQTKKGELGSAPSAEENQQLAALSQQASINLASAQQQAKGHLSKRRTDLIVEFRRRVSPVAKRIAAERGFSLVVPRSEGMFLAIDDQVDITDDVADALVPEWQPLLVPASSTASPTPQMAAQPTTGEVQAATYSEGTGQR